MPPAVGLRAAKNRNTQAHYARAAQVLKVPLYRYRKDYGRGSVENRYTVVDW